MNRESYNRECDGSDHRRKIKAIMARVESFAEASADLSPRRRDRGSDREAISEKCRAAMDETRAFYAF